MRSSVKKYLSNLRTAPPPPWNPGEGGPKEEILYITVES